MAQLAGTHRREMMKAALAQKRQLLQQAIKDTYRLSSEVDEMQHILDNWENYS